MRTVWRIIAPQWEKTAFDGEGARLHGGRWNSPGSAAVYTSESRALAALEILVHLPTAVSSMVFSFIPVHFPEGLVKRMEDPLVIQAVTSPEIQTLTQQEGDRWIGSMSSAVLQVPSAIIAAEWNYVLNPRHPDFSKVEKGVSEAFALDPRLLRRSGNN